MTPLSSAPTDVRTTALVQDATTIIKVATEGADSAMVLGLMVPLGPLNRGSSP
ncbi:hypothetical protein A2U01_0085015, partial [Trifolium medium]|nr:hypothetical protein [Trifolium medium]